MKTFGIAAVLVIVIGGAFVLRSLHVKRHRIIDAANAKSIGFSVRNFVQDKGRMPTSFGELAREQYLSAGPMQVAHGSETVVPKTAEDLDAGQCDYVINQKIDLQLQEDGTELKPAHPRFLIKKPEAHRTVMLYTKPGILPGGYMSVGFLDGSSTSVNTESLADTAVAQGWIWDGTK